MEGQTRAGAPHVGGRPQTAFRHAAEDDVAALVDLVNAAYRGDASRQGWTTEADLLGGRRVDAGQIAELLARPGTRVLIAERGGRVAACCELADGGDGSAYFGMFAVWPGAQGGGTGGSVLAEAERTAVEELGCTSMRMTVLRQRADLIGWYERRGYRRTGETAPFPYGDERFGLPKRDDLVFEELAKELNAPPGA
ncbi:GNAT family N-acetyltransferase [Streptomonospora wellingtoniae]|uniref:GNAT family N-acetyltransferase n=1 Tax=Streptomonospora wellingtoniae TaxID=3075544 RepID=A0ABU2KXX7_9ACTN|nr:GNAT family N-acetyltransferase [Streptomonospora sp. DSM 45055]MDT0304154.1 GNAT family N-acetyltransferase [Streptomonospora sp. DSM 45055]